MASTSVPSGSSTGGTRAGRNGEAVARWVHDLAAKRGDAEFEIVDLKDFDLPHLDEVMPPAMGQYEHPQTVALSLAADFEHFSVVKLAAHQADALTAMLNQLISWAGAMKPLRSNAATVDQRAGATH